MKTNEWRVSVKWCPLLVVAVLSSTVARTAEADPIQITSGGITMYGNGSSSAFGMAGPEFSMSVGWGWHPGGRGIGMYEPGDVLDLSTGVGAGGFGGASIAGKVQGDPEDAYIVMFRGGLRILADPLVVPPDRSLKTHFTMTGQISGVSRHTGAPFFTVDVVGSGRMSVSPAFGYPLLFNQTFLFDAPAAVPEPATILLLGTGLLALLRKRHT